MLSVDNIITVSSIGMSHSVADPVSGLLHLLLYNWAYICKVQYKTLLLIIFPRSQSLGVAWIHNLAIVV